MAKWWESPEKIHKESSVGIWWKGTTKNANRACPAWFATNIGFSTVPIQEFQNLGWLVLAVGGFKMTTRTLHGAGYIGEKAAGALIMGHAYCFGARLGGAIDALYQINHKGDHLSVDIADSIGYGIDSIDSFYMSRAKGVENFLNNVYRWWQT